MSATGAARVNTSRQCSDTRFMFRSAYPEAVQAEEMTDPSMNDVQIPVAPGSQPPQLEEPTTPVAQLDLKAEAARH